MLTHPPLITSDNQLYYMVRAGIVESRMLMLREAKQARSRFAATLSGGPHEAPPPDHHRSTKGGKAENDLSSCWVPHPRNGIYVPKGHERLMDDVPAGAASFGQTYWLRNVDGVEKPDPDDHSTHILPDRYASASNLN